MVIFFSEGLTGGHSPLDPAVTNRNFFLGLRIARVTRTPPLPSAQTSSCLNVCVCQMVRRSPEKCWETFQLILLGGWLPVRAHWPQRQKSFSFVTGPRLLSSSHFPFSFPFPWCPLSFLAQLLLVPITDKFLARGLELKMEPVEAREILDQSR